MSNAAEKPPEEEVTTEETDDLTVQEEEIEVEAVAEDAESEEDEIVMEGEEQPASSVPKGFLKRINKLNSRVDAAHEETEQERRKREMLEEENRLLKLKLTGTQKAPKPEDFDTDEEYDVANRKYQEGKMEAAVKAEAERLFQAQQQQSTQVAQRMQAEQRLTEHYQRAEQLKLKDYEQAEDTAIEVLGRDTAKHIMASTDKSHLVMYHLGKNPVKAEQIANMVRTNPIQALIEVGKIEARLQVKPRKSNAPEPVQDLPGGTAAKKTEYGPDGATYE